MKRRINAVLQKYKDNIYVFMPVPGGYGRSSLDYIGFVRGQGFAIEAKREGGSPTERQLGVIEAIEAAGGEVFVVNSTESLVELDEWLLLEVRAKRGKRHVRNKRQ